MRMNANALRTWGIAVSAGLMAVALMIAAPWRPADARAPAPVELAQAPAQTQAQAAAPVGFVVRFRGTGPIAQAQARAARGQTAAAGREIDAQLRRQPALAGLCFDRFTVGAAEVVLRSCAPVPASERAAYQARWLARLQAMRAVAYVDANATLTQERAPG